uniref:NADH:ubiquinone reductase (H(+)-translocating) n=1 Tax=Meloidogyne incognita TaxID=6306 RepID=A0A914KJC6_MELIC
MISVTAIIASTSSMSSMTTNITSTRINAHFFNLFMIATLITPIISSFRMGPLTIIDFKIMITASSYISPSITAKLFAYIFCMATIIS